jgi:hypothetical protein
MTSALAVETRPDYTDLPHVIRSSVRLGILHCILIALFGFLQPRLDGILELVICAPILFFGIAATIALPGLWTRARTIEGIAGAASIGFGAAIVFLAVDVILFQPLGLWTSRWLAIGGGSNWWYHPVWWMLAAYIPWLGAWIMANQAARTGRENPVLTVFATSVLALILLALAKLVGFPGATIGMGGFAVAVLPALAIYTAISVVGARRQG